MGPGGRNAAVTGIAVRRSRSGCARRAGCRSRAGRRVQKLLSRRLKRGRTPPCDCASARGLRAASVCAELQACIVPHDPAAKRRYVLRSIHDPNYAVRFADRSETDCIALQGSRSSQVACALSRAQLQDGYVAYPWERKMREALQTAARPSSSRFLSALILPRALDPAASRYSSLDDTLARADAWLRSAQASGVPIVFTNVQTEALLTKISGETASATVNSGSLADLSNLANASLYGFEDYHGVDIGVVKAVRLWYAPAAGELAVEIRLRSGDTKLGFAIGRTEEGFIYISSVTDDDGQDGGEVPSMRSGLRDRYNEARRASKLLVISRVSGEKVLPWMVSSSGAVRCFDTISLSQKLSLHRHALCPILLHLLAWEKPVVSRVVARALSVQPPPSELPLSLVPTPAAAESQLGLLDTAAWEKPVVSRVVARALSVQPPLSELPLSLVPTPAAAESQLELLDTAGNVSFRFHDNSPPNSSWV
ncbi:uncharacterized protein LOC109728272 [Ananas comosus]|uniref:Uncharacterized protein LOC109728272 n=1 Tax=Ananas comosus TaxID=4615 RepID=A0A6P5H2E6_ANACO|nr:uncharacterized protein LOC109728272 [Ananas comosus]